MLTDKEARAVTDLLYLAERYIEEGGGCDHSVGICYCDVTVSIINGYEILHASGHGEHNWVTDYEYDKDNNLIRVRRCEKCYAEATTAETKTT